MPWLRTAVLLGAGAGLRASEALGLTHDRLDRDRRTLRIDRQLAPDGDLGPPKMRSSIRSVPVSAALIEALGQGEGPVAHRDGRFVPYPALRARFTYTAGRAGLSSGTSFHDLRHHFASELIAAGCSIVAVASALGHDNPNVTLSTYGHLVASDEDRIRQALQADVEVLVATRSLGAGVIGVSRLSDRAHPDAEARRRGRA